MKKLVCLLLCCMLTCSLASCKTDDNTDNKIVRPENLPDYDFSSVPVQTFDPNYPSGAVYYADIADIINTVIVPDSPVKIGFVMKTLVNEYWSTVKQGIEDEIARLNADGFSIAVDIQAGASDSDKEGQLAVLRNMVNQKYDMIVVCPISDANLTPGIEEALNAGIPIVTMNTYFDQDPYVKYYIGASFYSQGQMAAQWVADNNPDGGEVAVIMGLADATSSIGCTDGFTQWIDDNPNANLTIVDIQSADWDRVRAQDIASTMLKQYPNLKAIFCNNDVMALGAVEAVKQAGMLDQIQIVGRDGTSEGVESIQNGELAASIGQFPYYMGKTSVQIVILAYFGIDIPDRIWIANAMIDQSNCDQDHGDILGWKEVNYQKP